MLILRLLIGAEILAAIAAVMWRSQPMFVIEHHHPESYGERRLREVLAQ
jgi:hypothetical protein